jgi:hypothetical protein
MKKYDMETDNFLLGGDPEKIAAYHRESLESFDIWKARNDIKISKIEKSIAELQLLREALIISSWPGGLRKKTTDK